MVNKLKTYRLRFGGKPENRQRTVAIGLGAIIAITTLAFLLILNTGIFTPGYAQPFIDWLHTSGGKVIVVSYLFILLVFILLSVNKTNHLIAQALKKVKLPLKPLANLKSRLSKRYTPDETKKRKTRLIYLSGFILILIPFVLFTFINQKDVEAGWWNDNWAYRKRVTITNSGSQQTDFQVYIELDTATLVSSGKMRSDCSDIRLLDYSTNKQIADPYWVGSCNETDTRIWIKMATVPTTDTILYIYYGNSTAGSLATAGGDVFDLFDDFSESSLDSTKWDIGNSGTGSESITNGILSITSTGDWWNTSDTSRYLLSKASFTSNYVFESRIIDNGSASYNRSMGLRASIATNSRMAVMAMNNGQTSIDVVERTSDGGSASSLGGGVAYSEPFYGRWTRDGTTHKAYADTTLINTSSSISNLDYVALTTTNGGTTQFDYAFVRQYASTEPSTSLSSEETGPGPVTHWKFNEGYDESYEQALTVNEQQINILNREYNSNSTSDYPTDNSLGIIHWDADKYAGATVYFEAVIRLSVDTGGHASYASLYTTGGSAVSGSTVSNPTSGTYAIFRSDPITLTDDTDYTVRTRVSWYQRSTYIKSARLIIVQSDATKITDTETQIEVGNIEKQTSDTATQLTDKKIYYYDSTKFSPAPTAYFEASLRNSQPSIEQQINIINREFSTNSTSDYPTDNSLGIIHWDADKYAGATVYFEAVVRLSVYTGGHSSYATLYTTGGSAVGGSTVFNPASGTYARIRSDAITLTDDTDYTVRTRVSWYQRTAYIQSARLIIIQSDATKIIDTETQIEVGNSEKQSSSTATQLTDKKIYYYDSSQFSPAPTAYFEASLRNSQPTIEQQVNIINQEYSSNSTTYNPSDNSLGIIHWDEDKYAGATVYFEAIMHQSADTSNRGYADLYTTGGSAVENSTVTSGGNAAYVRSRSGPLTLTDDTDYTVRIRSNWDQSTTYIQSARLIIIQSDGTKITDTETQIEVGDEETGFTNETASDLTDYKIYQYDQDQFAPVPESNGDIEFHASLKIDDATATSDSVTAELYNKTNSTVVATASHSGDTNWTLIRTTNVDGDADWDTTNDDEYIVRVYCTDNNGGGCSGNVANAKIAVNQSVTGGITDVEVVHQQVNTAKTDADTTYTSQDFLNRFNSDLETEQQSFDGGNLTFYYEATMKTNAGTAYAQLYNRTGNAAISNSEVATTSANYTRVRSGDITSDMPQYIQYGLSQNLDTQLKNSATNTTTASSTWFIIQVSSLATAGVTIYADLYNLTDTTQVASSEVSSTSNTWGRYRSGSITLTTGKEYVVRFKSSNSDVPIYLANAKIILDQTAAGGITSLETVQHHVNTAATDSDATYTDQGFATRYNPDLETNQRSFTGGVFAYYYESTLKTSAGTGYAQLYNLSDSSVISNSEVATTSANYTRARSGDITTDLPQYPQADRAKDLDTQLKNSATNTTTSSSSWVIVQVTNLATSGVTAYADLYNLTDSTQVADSEVSSTSTSWDLVRSSSITLTTDKEYVVRLYSSINNVTVHTQGAKIILDQTAAGGITSLETVQQMVNTLATDSDTGYTDQDFLNEYNPSNDHFIADNYNSSSVHFEATMKTSVGGGSNDAFTILTVDGGSTVSGSELETSDTDYDLVRSSSSIGNNMPGSTSNMDTQLKNELTATTSVSNSWMVIRNENTIPSLVNDSTANNLPGSKVGATWQSECKLQKCLAFDGVDDSVIVADDTKLDYAASDGFTLTGWFKRAETISGTEVLISKYNSATDTDGGYKVFLESDGNVTFGIDDDQTSFPEDTATSTTTGYDDNQWHHVAAVKIGTSSIKLYIDGEEVASDDTLSATGTLANSDAFYIGIDGDGTSNGFNGSIDDVKVYPYARTDDEIKTDYIGGSGVLGVKDVSSLTDDLSLHWKFDESSANTCDDTNDACDSSGNLNHARWEDNATSTSGKFAGAVNFDGTNDRVATTSANTVPPSSWYDSDWTKRKAINITNNVASALTNYQVGLTITYDSDMQADFDDLRFTNESGTLLDYWLESKTDSTTATVWTEVGSIPASGISTIYMYYGNSSVSSASNGDDTFQFFDDASGTYGDKWTDSEGSGSYASVGGRQAISLNSATTTIRSLTYQMSGAFTIEADLYTTAVITAIQYNQDSTPTTNERYHARIDVRGGLPEYLVKDGGLGSGNDVFSSASTWVDSMLKLDSSGNHTWTVSGSTGATRTSDTTYTNGYLALNHTNSGTGAVDNVRVREYASTEPTPAFGSEQDASNTTATPITISAWVNADTLGATDRVIIARNSSGSYSWAIYNDSSNPGKLAFTSDGETTTGVSDTTLSTGNWYHVAMTVIDNTTRLYINGVLDSEINSDGTLPGTGDISVGADPDGTDGWDGKIDDVRIYSRALDAGAVGELYKWAPGPVVYYNFDQGEGTTTVYDKSGNQNHGTMYGSMTEDDWIRGKAGGALDFDGDNDYLQVDADPTMDLNLPLSLSFWLKSSSISTEVIIMRRTSSGGNWNYAISTNDAGGKLRLALGGSGYNLTTDVFDGSWHHISATATDTGNVSWYVDGVEKDTYTGAGVNTNPSSITCIGKNQSDATTCSNSYYFDGVLDEMKIYNHARTPEQVIEDMNTGHPAPGSPISDPVVYLKMDEGYGDTTYDSSAFGNNGNLGDASSCPGSGDCPIWTNGGKFNKALSFEVTGGDYVVIDYDSTLDLIDDFTLSAWIYDDTLSGYDAIINKMKPGGQIHYGLFTTGDEVVFAYHDSGGGFHEYTTSSVNLQTTQWHHVAITYSFGTGSSMKIYVDGIPAIGSWTTNNGNTDAVVWTSDVWIGRQNHGSYPHYFDGIIDEVKIYDYKLSSSQIAQDMNQHTSSVMGALSTDSSGNASMSSDRSYCPPGDATATCGPIAEWKLDENTGTSAYDTSENNYTGTFSSAPIWQHSGNCKFGSCLEFDGSDDYLQNDSWDYSSIATAFTIDGWFYFSGSSNDAYITSLYEGGAGVTDQNYSVMINTSDQLCARSGDSDVAFNPWLCASTITENQWYYFSFIHNGTANQDYLYLNGQLIDNDTGNTDVSGLETPRGIVIGENWENEGASDHYFPGRLDQIRVFGYAHSSSQIAWNYNQGKPVGWWKLNECQGGTAYDSGSGGNNGTITVGGSGSNTSLGTCSSGTGTEAWNNGTIGKRNASLDFDGTDDWVDLQDTNDQTTNDLTLSAWIKTDSSSAYQYIIAKGDHRGDQSQPFYSMRIDQTTGYATGLIRDNANTGYATVTGTTDLSDGVWHHVLVVYDRSSNAELFIDGKSENTASISGESATLDSGVDLALGVRYNTGSNGLWFNGQIDEVKVFNYALTEQQILTTFREGAVKF